jgi:hypothetical protein
MRKDHHRTRNGWAKLNEQGRLLPTGLDHSENCPIRGSLVCLQTRPRSGRRSPTTAHHPVVQQRPLMAPPRRLQATAATRMTGSTGATPRYLTDHLRLVVNQEKSRVVSSNGVEFLGFVFTGRRATINVTSKNVSKFKRRIKELTGRSWGVSMERRLSELRSYLRGWAGDFGLAAQLKLFDKLDQWIRRRLRMCYWKRWRYPRTRSRELMRLGISRRQAIRHGKSRKSYWHMAKTIASGVGMTNKWLQEQGLVSLKSLWASLAPLR